MKWIKSSKCAADSPQCVEVASVEGYVAVRDTKDPDSRPLLFSRKEWTAFRDGMKAGDFDGI